MDKDLLFLLSNVNVVFSSEQFENDATVYAEYIASLISQMDNKEDVLYNVCRYINSVSPVI